MLSLQLPDISELLTTYLYPTLGLLFASCYLLYYLRYRCPYLLITSKRDLSQKNIGRPLPPYPNGWYNIMMADQLKIGQVKNVDIAGENVVVFRGDNGEVHALEAYCLHMGANLGIGGEVKNGNCVMCPFHGWLYDGRTGKCVDHDGKALKLKSIQYNDDLCSKNGKINWKTEPEHEIALHRYPVAEMNGYIYIWIHAMPQYRKEPLYPMIDVKNFLKPLVYRGRTQHRIACHVQDIPENGSDTLHFKYVHTRVVPWTDVMTFDWGAKWKRGDDPTLPELFTHKKKYVQDFKQRVYKELIEPFPDKSMISIGNLQNELCLPLFGRVFILSGTIIQIGLPIVFVILKAPMYEIVLHHYIRPQDKSMQNVFHDCFISPYIPYFISSFASQSEGMQVTSDMFVWEGKQFARKAHLMDGRESDSWIKGWREWASQHYQGCAEKEKERKKQQITW